VLLLVALMEASSVVQGPASVSTAAHPLASFARRSPCTQQLVQGSAELAVQHQQRQSHVFALQEQRSS
jgi:hypothetical protein